MTSKFTTMLEVPLPPPCFAAFSNISLETFAPNLVSLTRPRYWAKLRRVYFQFPNFWSTLIKENCQNSRTSDDIDMKLGPVTKFDKGNKTRLTMTSCQQIVT